MRCAVLIDGGYLRALSQNAGKTYNPDFIERFAQGCLDPSSESLFRVLYYDCAPYNGDQPQPVSGTLRTFKGSDLWLRKLGEKDLFAVRLGVLKFRGWKPKNIPVSGKSLSDNDFAPDMEQKGVDMRIGLDMANLSKEKPVDRVILVTADTDFIPAMKYARTSGLQVVTVEPPNGKLTQEFLMHADIKRNVGWP